MGSASETITIPARFNGPLDSGNGGYSCGVFAAPLGGVAEVSLRSPVPLDAPLAVERQEDGSVRILDGETLVAEARPVAGVEVEVPDPVGVEDARRASTLYRSPSEGIFSRCFVCGPAREDSFGVFAGLVEGRDLVASPWTPPEWAADSSGEVRPEFVWAALDCPTYFAAHPEEEGMPLSFLVRQSVEILAPVAAGVEHVVVAWRLGVEGRKRHVGAAVLSADGEPLAVARVLMLEPRAA
jgi:hypothetical protein